MIYQNVLWKDQKRMISLLDKCSDRYYLVGWTAIALQIGHRESIDFDLFCPLSNELDKEFIDRILIWSWYSYSVLIDTSIHYEILIENVKITRYAYPYSLTAWDYKLSEVTLPSLLQLSAMKVHAIQRRAKWKDYVDLSILFGIVWTKEILKYASNMFWWAYSSKLLASQLVYIDDVDFSEKVIWCTWWNSSNQEVLSKLQIISKLILQEVL